MVCSLRMIESELHLDVRVRNLTWILQSSLHILSDT